MIYPNFLKIKDKKILTPTEFIAVCYILLTTCYILIFFNKIENAPVRLLFRVLFLAEMFFMAWLAKKIDNKTVKLIRYAFPIALILFWYPETAFFNDCLFPKLDKYFAATEEYIFGCQPSLMFSQIFHGRIISEIMAFGYFSFYLTIAFTVFYFFRYDKKIYEKISFIIMFSFFIFYLIFILLPVEGPQFYFTCNKVPEGFLFYKILAIAQFYGERGTGAFPSSHIGMSLIFLFIFFKYQRNIFYILLTIFVILALSTIYIKAHYIIDVIGGFIVAPVFYWASCKVFKKLEYRLE